MNDFMALALQQARAAAARGEVPVGAVLVQDGRVVAAAGNRVEELTDPTAHAEILVLRQAAAAANSPRLGECDLYVTLEPCPMCATAISFARIRRVYFGAYDPKGGGIEHGPRIFDHATCHHRPEVIGGMAEAEAAELLRAFFRDRR
ncbi:MAG TPA: nucleoside deaminase [Magnetospirillum sp.]|jgi:tRNA(adenine34) deaminase|nr:nucleoside deaminase [Magnetospirillum sp.]